MVLREKMLYLTYNGKEFDVPITDLPPLKEFTQEIIEDEIMSHYLGKYTKKDDFNPGWVKKFRNTQKVYTSEEMSDAMDLKDFPKTYESMRIKLYPK